ncbi:hypothetical protein Tco_1136195 [Tanacetum coccineum]
MSTPATAEEKTNKKNDVKAKGLLLMALPNEHQLIFSQYPDAKSMFAAIETRFGGNAATKKTQKTLLKQRYENFSATSAESLDYIFNRLQKIVSRLAILGVIIAQLVTYRKNKVLFSEEVAVLKREVGFKTYEFNMLKTEFEKVKQEKEGIDFTIEKFKNALKDLDKLLGSQITDNSKKELGYHVVPPPHPLIYNAPTKLDLSYFGLEEFKQPEFEGYGVKVDKSVCEKSSKEIKKTPGAPIIEDWVSDNESKPKKKTVIPTAAKIEFVRPKQQEKPARKPVKYAEMYMSQSLRGNQRN